MIPEIQIPTLLITILQVILAFGGAFFIALWISLIIWTFRDVRSRSRDIFAILLATLMVVIFGPLGLVLYFLLRPPVTLAELYERSLEEEALLQDLEQRPHCPGCSRQVEPTWIICPDCHTALKKTCPACGSNLHLQWDVCPYCAASVAPEEPAFPPETAEPASPPQSEIATRPMSSFSPDEAVEAEETESSPEEEESPPPSPTPPAELVPTPTSTQSRSDETRPRRPTE